MKSEAPLARIRPAFSAEAVVVVFASDGNYAPYLGVTLKSLIDHASDGNLYDVLVLDGGLGAEPREKLRELSAGRDNFSLRFIDMKAHEEKFASLLRVGGGDHVSAATYYRLFITSLCAGYEKVVYLDCDLAILADVAELFRVDLEGMALGAVLDFFACRDFLQAPGRHKKWISSLGLAEPSKYFNAGVILFDLDKMREFDFEGKALAALGRIKKPKLHDQDILNSVCQGRVKFLDPAWQCQAWVEESSPERLLGGVPDDVYERFVTANKAPKIIHYMTHRKPWFEPGPPLASHFWRYAAQTPFYQEILLKNLARRSAEAELFKKYIRHPHGWLTWFFYKTMGLAAWGERRRHYRQRAARLRETLAAIKKMARL